MSIHLSVPEPPVSSTDPAKPMPDLIKNQHGQKRHSAMISETTDLRSRDPVGGKLTSRSSTGSQKDSATSRSSSSSSSSKNSVSSESSSDQNSKDGNGDDDEDDQSFKPCEIRKGGYHNVAIGDKYASGRYVIEKKLGFGYFSTVWLASDQTKSDSDPHKLVAIKISKSEESFQEAAQDEVKLLQTLGRNEFTIALLDQFTIHGPNGKHYCLVFETMWKDLFYLIKKFDFRGVSPKLLQVIIYQVLCGVEYMHSKQIIHTDIKPEYFLISLPFDIDVQTVQKERQQYTKLSERIRLYNKVQSASTMSKNQRKRLRDKLKTSSASDIPTADEYEAYCAEILKLEKFKTPETLDRTKNLIVKVADLGNGCLVNKHNSSDITTRQYRSPEVLLGYPYGTPVDIFSCGAVFFELATGHVLFQPAKNRDSYLRNEDHLSLIYRTTGYMPRHLIKEGKYSGHYFNRRCEFLHYGNQQPRPLLDLLKYYRCSVADLDIFSDFLSKCIEPDPLKRWTAAQLKLHPWLSGIHKSFSERGMSAFNLN